jgi:hypothetical protein
MINATLEPVKQPNIIATFRDHIEELALAKTLKAEDLKLREKFKDLFEPIPHVNNLPTDCMAQIQLKDPTIRVKLCSYPCLCKYRDAWQTLIKQHLDARCI